MIAFLKGLYGLYEQLPNGELKLIEEQRQTDSNKILNYLGMDFDFFVKKHETLCGQNHK